MSDWTLAQLSGKAAHRGWVWREIRRTRRVAGRPVLYLVGPSDVDRAVAEALDVDTNTLVAIDTVAARVEAVRRDGGRAVRINLCDALAAWPLDWEIGGVHADMYCGLAGDSLRLIDALLRAPIIGRIVVNLQRGRENAGGAFAGVRSAFGHGHRGHAWLFGLALRAMQECPDPTDAQVAAVMDRCAPSFATYRSRCVTMDSVAFTLPWQLPRAERRRVPPPIAALRAVMSRDRVR